VRFDYASVGGVSLARDQIGGSIIGTRRKSEARDGG
jgi:hypothetical protein